MPKSELYILVALATKEQHGYEIMQYVQTISHSTVTLGPGTLYTALKRLLDNGYIADAGEREESDKRERKYYKLTAKGRKALGAELSAINALLALPAVKQVLKTV
ncbi:MAG TPA: helix-turn-helix transcriptional regulator [Candidatus Paceibacterota bacterium]|nr:helix-turn-helix transcriptional regulator [Candidatus Paceibacterota bacterium]